MVEPHSSNFRVITTNFLGVRIFRKFTVHPLVRYNIVVQIGHDVGGNVNIHIWVWPGDFIARDRKKGSFVLM